MGCFACFNICPQKSITMVENEYGEVYPQINKDTCIHCGLCEKICPQLKEKLKFNTPIKVFAMYNKNAKLRKESTSGGAATTFYEYYIRNKGICYGVSSFVHNNQIKFVRFTNENELKKVKGSKYTHCYVNDIYIKVKEDLLNNKKVLFIGTPCQVSGLKSFLINDFDNLTTIDIICHGVPSQRLLFDEIKRNKINVQDNYKISFRDNNGYILKILDQDNNIIIKEEEENVDYYRHFLHGNIFRENCYSCKYAQRNRISDITIGDFWGLDKKSKIYDDESKGISVILINSSKGLELFEKIKDNCIFEERTIEEACKHNGQLNHPMPKSKEYLIYRKMYPKKGYKRTMSKMKSMKYRIKTVLKKNKYLYDFLKRIKNYVCKN